ncbi:PREDICTED: bifunctional epoxide hydrolase 2-like isoform X3 [Brassica oleracea var. oleracea]|uniref:bifunctional epoxide hydrolase 2-like isoform X3 n=1 Tax=Brassica oleracea var. oleracea TaxID=109376 RepID=UPI0006A6B21E|nr:PREDICTED: bifunctional epoxide hydrolase 2-like isoform X3 [Brassica oleracea var. oleracea]
MTMTSQPPHITYIEKSLISMYQLCSKKSLCFVAACWFTQSLSLSLSFIYPGIMAREVREQRIKTNGIWLNVVEKGDNGGPLVLLLHGFPETWFSWRHQIDFLSSHGYHVVAPDLRGYADSDSPPSHESYTVSHLVADVIGLLDHYGTAQAFVSGHDWGATIGWSLCLFRPDRVKGFISLSAPYFPRHPNLKPLEFFKSFGDGLYISQRAEVKRKDIPKQENRERTREEKRRFFVTSKSQTFGVFQKLWRWFIHLLVSETRKS